MNMIRIFIPVFFIGLVLNLKSQSPVKKTFPLPTLSFPSSVSTSQIILSFSSASWLKKDLSMKYQPAKLPFFCSMEEKSRNKFHVFFKLRAGNDESYMKMIAPSNNRYQEPKE